MFFKSKKMAENTKNNKSEDLEVTLKEAASKLDISEPTVKKYLKDFDLRFEKRPGNKSVVSDEVFQALVEIVKLRANGLSIQEIKELKSQEPSKHILDEIEESQTPAKPEEVKVESPEVTESNDLIASLEAPDVDEEKEDSLPGGEEVEVEASDEEVKDEDESGDDAVEGSDSPRRRRGFNYRYVERQISTDSKKVSSLRQRLRNTNLSVQDRLYLEESLERRILFLNGWKHILRWISK